jgi:NAD(P)-dependent dehydrogenase (short-subunit alcohol dehydrogenase family)
MFDVNALGCVRVVLALLPHLKEGSKIMFVGIGPQALNGLLTPTHSKGNYGYRMSKAAMTAFASGVARDLRERGIAVAIGSPGAVNTPLLQRVYEEGRTPFDPSGAADPFEIGRMFRDRIDELTLETSPSWQAKPSGELVLTAPAPH